MQFPDQRTRDNKKMKNAVQMMQTSQLPKTQTLTAGKHQKPLALPDAIPVKRTTDNG
jgi:hypothetical protein